MYKRCTTDVQQMYIRFTILYRKRFYLMVGEIFLIGSTMNWWKLEGVFSNIINSILVILNHVVSRVAHFWCHHLVVHSMTELYPYYFLRRTLYLYQIFYCVEMHHIFRLHVYDFVHLILCLVPTRRHCCSVLFLMHWSLWFCVTLKEMHLALYL